MDRALIAAIQTDGRATLASKCGMYVRVAQRRSDTIERPRFNVVIRGYPGTVVVCSAAGGRLSHW
ncbi:hypothetical protein OHA25_16070 [Nonomuraea sp. NBC_00507]|uniref:hypothetical protein n=1 Tax=Nonomuraea sp. NBC_00507 TaxID=2976002 RepID=UPI002E18A0FC